MAEKTKVDVIIAGKPYTIIGYESDEYIQRIGLYVDKKMGEISKGNGKLSTSGVAVLAALNVADDYFKAHENELNFKKEIVTAKLETEKLLEENLMLEDKYKELLDKHGKLQIEIAKREAELSEVRNSLGQHTERKLEHGNRSAVR